MCRAGEKADGVKTDGAWIGYTKLDKNHEGM